MKILIGKLCISNTWSDALSIFPVFRLAVKSDYVLYETSLQI